MACRGTEERPDKSPGYSAVFSCVFFFLVFFFKKALILFSRSESHILQCDASPEEVGGEVEGGGGGGDSWQQEGEEEGPSVFAFVFY